MTTALVLGGGGVTGVAWEIGVLAGLRDGPLGDTVTAPDLVVGTSAGSVVGVHVAAGSDLDELVAAQRRPAPGEIARSVSMEDLVAAMTTRLEGATDALDARQRIGALARETDDAGAGDRRRAVAGRLPVVDWPDRPLRITAVDTGSGEVVVFDRAAGVALADAVAASCAVPGVWPVVGIDGRQYMDGGAASMCHATLAAGHDRVVVLSPVPTATAGPGRGLDDEVAELRAAGVDVVVVGPDEDYLAGPGSSPLDPAGRPASVDAGLRHARRPEYGAR